MAMDITVRKQKSKLDECEKFYLDYGSEVTEVRHYTVGNKSRTQKRGLD